MPAFVGLTSSEYDAACPSPLSAATSATRRRNGRVAPHSDDNKRAPARSRAHTRHKSAWSWGWFFPWLVRRCRCRRRSLRRRLFRGRGGSGGRRIFLGRFFVRATAIISGVETRALEDQSSPCAKKALYLPMSPSRQPAKLFRALAEWFVAHGLKCLKGLVAFCARILVGGHGRKRPRKSA